MSKLQKAEKHLRRLGELIDIIDQAKAAEAEAEQIGILIEKLIGPPTGDWGPNGWLGYWNDVLNASPEHRTWNKDVDELMLTLTHKRNAVIKLTKQERAALCLDDHGNPAKNRNEG